MKLLSKTAIFLCLLSTAVLAAEPAPAIITGKVIIQKHGAEEWLVLYGVDGTAYRLTGDLYSQIKKSSQDIGPDNLISIKGTADGTDTVSCSRKSLFETDKNGKQILKTENQCVRYNKFVPSSIISTAQSKKPLPPLIRDTASEAAMTDSSGNSAIKPPLIGEIYGVIAECNFRAPIKTIEVSNNDTASPLKKAVLLITANSKIVKKITNSEPMNMSVEYLKTGQKVTVVYSKKELASEALFITVTGE